MKGAYCLACHADGPDLSLSSSSGPVPVGTRAIIAFTCGGCKARWEWTVTWTEFGPRYTDPRRVYPS
jgi:hypothetical protein